MFQLGRLYHLTQVVDDLDAADTWMSTLLGARRIYRGRHDAALRNASILVVGNAVVELIEVIKSGSEPVTPLQKYHARFGQHFHSIAMFVDDLGDAGEILRSGGVRMTDTVGRRIEVDRPDCTIWTHPRDTIVMFEFATVPRFHFDPRLHASWSDTFWRSGPLGLQRLTHASVVVSDLDRARRVFGELMGRPVREAHDHDGQPRLIFDFGVDLDLEVSAPTIPDSAEGHDLLASGDGPFGYGYEVADLDQVIKHLDDVGQPYRRRWEREIVIGAADAHGTPISFREADA